MLHRLEELIALRRPAVRLAGCVVVGGHGKGRWLHAQPNEADVPTVDSIRVACGLGGMWLRNGTIMMSREQPEVTMPANLTLKGVPDEVYERLKEAATVNHRSLNSEIIAVLESQVLPRRVSAQEHLAAIRAARARLKRADFDHTSLDRIKREGRA